MLKRFVDSHALELPAQPNEEVAYRRAVLVNPCAPIGSECNNCHPTSILRRQHESLGAHPAQKKRIPAHRSTRFVQRCNRTTDLRGIAYPLELGSSPSCCAHYP